MPAEKNVCQNGTPCESAPKTEEKASTQPVLKAENTPQPNWEMLAPKPFVANTADRWFALGFYLLGYLYVRYMVLNRSLNSANWQFGWLQYGVTLFVCVFAAAVLGYCFIQRRTVPKQSWFWLDVLLALAAAYSLWQNTALAGWQGLALHAAAVYWTLTATGALVEDKTGSFLPADLLNGFIIVPFGNFFARIRCMFMALRGKGSGKKALQILLGVGLLFLALLCILPLLMNADESFAALVNGLQISWANIWYNEHFGIFLFGLPVGAYLFGLAYGGVHKCCTAAFVPNKVRSAAQHCHAVPDVSTYTVLGGVCAVYVLYIAVQAKSLFSAFGGQLYGTDNYSEYAREGFFGLCFVAVLNAALLLAANVCSKTPRKNSRVLRMFNIVLACLTLLILASAAQKMFLYVGAYGLTPKRVLVVTFLLFLAVVFVALIIWQFKQFNLVRGCFIFGAVLFCALALCNIDGIISSYNAAHEKPQQTQSIVLDR